MALAKKKKLFALNHFFCGLTPELSRAAKRRRLERIVRRHYANSVARLHAEVITALTMVYDLKNRVGRPPFCCGGNDKLGDATELYEKGLLEARCAGELKNACASSPIKADRNECCVMHLSDC